MSRMCVRLIALLAPASIAVAQPEILAGPFEYGGHEYYLLEASTWTSARAAALALGGQLATINDASENDWVWAELANFGGEERWVWIGFNDAKVEGTWEWASRQPVNYVNWAGGEPNDLQGEDYGHMWQGGLWNDNANNGHNANTLYGVVEVEPSCYPDLNASGALDLFDFLAFVNFFNTQDPAADCDASGGLDLFDFLCFTNAFNAGC